MVLTRRKDKSGARGRDLEAQGRRGTRGTIQDQCGLGVVEKHKAKPEGPGVVKKRKFKHEGKPQVVRTLNVWNEAPLQLRGREAKKQIEEAENAVDVIPAGFEVNESKIYQGFCHAYWTWRGSGWIRLDQKGVVPGDKAFVRSKHIVTEDRVPQLRKGMKVQFNICVAVSPQDGGTRIISARKVCKPGGAAVAVQKMKDLETKEFVGGQDRRYAGTLKSYNVQRGFGYIAMNEGYVVDETLPKELRCEEPEMNAGGQKPGLMSKVKEVEFGICWSKEVKKGKYKGYKAYNVTLPGGLPLPAMKKRRVKRHRGKKDGKKDSK